MKNKKEELENINFKQFDNSQIDNKYSSLQFNKAISNNLLKDKKDLKFFKNRKFNFTISSRKLTQDQNIEEYIKKYFPYIDFSQVESFYGFADEFYPLYGGRGYKSDLVLNDKHTKELEDRGINISLTLTNHYFDETAYTKSLPLLKKYHQMGNSIVCVNDELAKRIREDFPLYKLKASLIKDLNSVEKVSEALKLYDLVVIPMELNDDYEFLTALPHKDRIVLFANANCAYNCESRICYQAISKENIGREKPLIICSKDIVEGEDLGYVYFDIKKFSSLGFTNFKLLPNGWEVNEEEINFDFSSLSSDNFPKILKALNISLAVTSYQSARLILVRSNGENIDTNLKQFPRPMGIYADEERITIGTFNQVLEFKRSDRLLEEIKNGKLDNTGNFSKKVLEKDKEQLEELKKTRENELEQIKRADSLYLHRAALTTGMINIHDIAWGDEGLWVVNSTFSCLSTLSPDSSFIARWKPKFITELVPEDRCHLNGMAMVDGRPKYVTTFNMEDSRDSWSSGRIDYGTLIDIDTDEILIEGMIMPHSPKVYNGEVYVCESGLGVVWKYNPITKEKTQVVKLQGFTRGLYFYGGVMFVGTSKIRASEIKNPTPLSKEYDETYAGVWMINLEDNTEIGYLKFEGDVDQIYDIAIIPDSTMPELLNINSSLTRHLFDFEEINI